MLQDVLQSDSNIAENCPQSCIFVQSIPKRDRGVSAPIKISNIQAKKPFFRTLRERGSIARLPAFKRGTFPIRFAVCCFRRRRTLGAAV